MDKDVHPRVGVDGHRWDWENWDRPFMWPFREAWVGLEGWGGVLLLCSYVFLEDEAGQQGGGLLHRQVVEEAVENHLRQQELVAARDTDAGR